MSAIAMVMVMMFVSAIAMLVVMMLMSAIAMVMVMMFVSAIAMVMVMMFVPAIAMVMVMMFVSAIAMVMVMMFVSAIAMLVVMVMAAAAIAFLVFILLRHILHGPGDGLGDLLFQHTADDIIFPHNHKNGRIIGVRFDVGHQQLPIFRHMLKYRIGFPGIRHQGGDPEMKYPAVGRR